MEIQFNSGTFLVMMINFLLLMFVLIWFLYRPIQGILEQRRQKIAQDLDEAQKSKEMAERLHKESKIALEESHVEAYEIVEKARNEAERLRQELTVQTRQEMDSLRKRTYEEIERAKANAKEQLREEAVSLALLAMEKLFSQQLTQEINESMVRAVVDEIEKGEQTHGVSGRA